MLFSPFEFWLTAFKTGEKFAATLMASNAVIDSRMRTMAHAAGNPLEGDYAELSRMVPEKVKAFSQAGTSMLTDMAALQTQALTNWNAAMGLVFGGHATDFGDWMAIANRSSRIIERANEAGGRALGPVYRAATGNARRLRMRA